VAGFASGHAGKLLGAAQILGIVSLGLMPEARYARRQLR
jgi:hypothetical protein